MTEQQLNDGGWRIPFVIGGVAALLSLAARSRLERQYQMKMLNVKNREGNCTIKATLENFLISGGLYLSRFTDILCSDCIFKDLPNQYWHGW